MTKSKNARGGVELECHGICVCLVLSWELLYGRWISSRATVCPETKPIKTAVGIDRKTSPIVQFVSAGQTDSTVILQPDVNEAFQSERSGTYGMLWFSYSPRGPLCLSSHVFPLWPGWQALSHWGRGHLSFSGPKALPSACGFKS